MPINIKVNQNVASPQSKAVIIAGNVAITGATGAVGAQTGVGFTVVKDGTGLYTVTFAGAGALPILHASASVAVDDTAGFVAKVLTITSSTRKVEIQIAAEAAPETPAHPPAGALIQVYGIVNNVPVGRN